MKILINRFFLGVIGIFQGIMMAAFENSKGNELEIIVRANQYSYSSFF